MTAQEISDKIINKTGINVFDNSRKREVIHHRSLLIYLLEGKDESKVDKHCFVF